jgi:hypothetical protein
MPEHLEPLPIDDVEDRIARNRFAATAWAFALFVESDMLYSKIDQIKSRQSRPTSEQTRANMQVNITAAHLGHIPTEVISNIYSDVRIRSLRTHAVRKARDSVEILRLLDNLETD